MVDVCDKGWLKAGECGKVRFVGGEGKSKRKRDRSQADAASAVSRSCLREVKQSEVKFASETRFAANLAQFQDSE